MKTPKQGAAPDAPTSRAARCPDLSGQGTPIVPHSEPTCKLRGLTPIARAVIDYMLQLAQTVAANGDPETARALLGQACRLARQVQP
ncbi:hypothetical protein ACFLUM_03790 [Chloroflexota bacterium]